MPIMKENLNAARALTVVSVRATDVEAPDPEDAIHADPVLAVQDSVREALAQVAAALEAIVQAARALAEIVVHGLAAPAVRVVNDVQTIAVRVAMTGDSGVMIGATIFRPSSRHQCGSTSCLNLQQ